MDSIKSKLKHRLNSVISHLTSYGGPAFFVCLVFSAARGLTLLLCFPGSFLLLPIPLPLFGCCWRSRSWRSSGSRGRPPRRFPFLPALFPPVVSASPGARCGAGGKRNNSVTLHQQQFKQTAPTPAVGFTDPQPCQQGIPWQWPNRRF